MRFAGPRELFVLLQLFFDIRIIGVFRGMWITSDIRVVWVTTVLEFLICLRVIRVDRAKSWKRLFRCIWMIGVNRDAEMQITLVTETSPRWFCAVITVKATVVVITLATPAIQYIIQYT
jgi:hypothetical protein